mmetsp:Transcript_17217/g.40527  ORF Transcript_17217/g.40527 Transcript_17217/m.40527 type:complete len:582 (+) Transcript_17217:65-1810(+)
MDNQSAEVLAASKALGNRQFAEAHEQFSEAERRLEQAGPGHRASAALARAWAAYSLACSLVEQEGCVADACAQYEIAITLFRDLPAPEVTAIRLSKARLAEAKAINEMNQGRYSEAQGLVAESKTLFMSVNDTMGIQRSIFASAYVAGQVLASKADRLVSVGQLEQASEAYNDACAAFLKADIHAPDQPPYDPFTSEMRQRVARGVATTVKRRRGTQELLVVVQEARDMEGRATIKAEAHDFEGACDCLRQAMQMFSRLGPSFEGAVEAAQQKHERFELMRIATGEVHADQMLLGNNFVGALNLLLKVCKDYNDVASSPKSKQQTGKDARKGHLRTTALILEIAGIMQSMASNPQRLDTPGEAPREGTLTTLPRLPHAWPSRLHAGGVARPTLDNPDDKTDYGALLAQSGAGVLFEHRTRRERKGYEGAVTLFNEGKRLYAMAGDTAAASRMDLLVAQATAHDQWALGKLEAASASFTSIPALLTAAYPPLPGAPRLSSVGASAATAQALAADAMGRHLLVTGQPRKAVSHLQASATLYTQLSALLRKESGAVDEKTSASAADAAAAAAGARARAAGTPLE